jgi:fibronectin-binding autotransporter adhesin
MKSKYSLVRVRASRRSFIPAILASAFVCSLLVPKVQAADRWWDNVGGTANDWGSINNWSTVVGGGTNPTALPTNADLVIFNASSLTAAQTISLGGADRSVLGISMINATNAVTIQGTGTNSRTLTIAGSGIAKSGTGAITIGNTTANTNANVRLSADQTWTNSNNTGAISVVNTVAPSTAVNRKLTLGGTSTAGNIISGVISNNGAGVLSIDKIGAGNWTLSGANTHTGATSIAAGLLQVNNNAGLGTAAVTISDGRLRINNGVTLGTGNSITVNSGVTGAASTGLIERNSGTAGVARVNGTITLNGSPTGGGTFYNNLNTAGNELYIGGAINGSANAMSQRQGRVIYAGGGSLAGIFTMTDTIVVGANNGIPVALTHILGGSASATLDLNGFNQAVAGMQLGNSTNPYISTVNVRAGTLTLNGNITNVTATTQAVTHQFTGTTGGIDVGSTTRTLDVVNATPAEDVIMDIASITGTGGITKTGAGTLSLGHTSGTTNIAGPLTISGGGVLVGRPSIASTINVSSLVLASGTSLNVKVGTGGDLIAAGAVTSAGTTVNVSQFGGALVVGNTYPFLSYTGTTPGVSNFTPGTIAGHATGNIVDTGTAIAFQVTGNDKIIWDGTASTAWATGATGNWKLQTGGAATDYFSTDDVIFADSPTASTVNIATAVLPSNVAITNTTATSYLFTGAGGITGTTGITKTGDGTATLRTPTTYTGATTVSAGKLEFDYDGGTTLSATSGISIASGATLMLNSDGTATATTTTLNRNLSGAGTIEVNMRTGAAAAASDGLSVTGTNTAFSGAWVLKAPATGTYRLQDVNPTRLGSGDITVESGAQLYVQGALTYNNNVTIAGTGFADSGGNIGALRLEANAIWAGNITVAAGGARIGAHNTSATVSGAISGGDLNVNGSDGTFNNPYTILFTGTNSYGKTTIGGGSTATGVSSRRLNIGNGGTSGTLGAGVVEITGDGQNGILGFDRSDGYTLATGQTITAVGATPSRTYIDIDSQGIGFSNAGNAITLGTANANAGGGGFFRIGMTRAASVANLDGNVTSGRLIVGGNTLGNGSIANFNNGLVANLGYLPVGEAASSSGTVNHNTGATVNVASQLRVGHFGTLTSTYNMNGGTLTMTGASPNNSPSTAGSGDATTLGDGNLNITNPTTLVGGGIYLGIDGMGIMNHTGGTVTTNWLVLDNRGATAAGTNMSDGIDRYNLSGAGSVLNLRSTYGFIGRNEGSYAVSFGGGSVKVDNTGTGTGTGANLTIPLDATIDTVAATTTNLDTNGAGNAFTLTKNVTGTGALNLTGGGAINLSTTAIQNIEANLTGSTGINKLGAGTTTLTGTASGYTGPITVSAGRLNVPNSLGAGDLTVADGASIAGEPVAVSTLTLGSTTGSTVFFDPNTSGALTTNNLVANGTTTLDLTAVPTGAGPYTVINYTSKSGAGTFAVANPANYRTAPTVDDTTGSKVSVNVTGQLNLTWTGAASGVWDINSAVNWNNPTPTSDVFFTADHVTFPEGGANSAITLTGLLAPSSIAVTASSTAYTFTATAGNQITGATAITKSGAGALTLTGANAYSGKTTISGGVVNIDSTNSIGNGLAGNSLEISGGARLSYSAAAALDLGVNRNIAVGTGGGSISHNNATAATISIPGNLTSGSSDTLSFHSNAAGGGSYVLSGDNSGFTGNITADALSTGLTLVRLANQDAVPASGTITLNYPAAGVSGNATVLELPSVNLPSAITLNMTSFLNGAISLRSEVRGNGVVEINSPVKLSGSSIVQFQLNGGTMTHNGAITESTAGAFTGTAFFRGTAGTHIVNSVFNLPTAGSTVAVTDLRTVVINSTGNVWSSSAALSGILRIGANDALCTTAPLTVGQTDSNNATFDTNGFNQTVGGLIHVAGTGGTKTVTNSSTTPSTFTVDQATNATWGGITSGALAVVKSGVGNLTFSNTGSTFTGNVTVNDGTLTATGASGGTNSTLGAVNATRTVTVNSPGTLALTTNNIFGNGVANVNLPSLVVNGGTVAVAHYNVVGNVTLNGATVSQTSVATANYHGLQFRGTVTVGGSAASTISTTNARGTHLGTNTTFTVSDVTGDVATDLVVTAQLINQSTDFTGAAGGLTKDGAGTMSLSGANTYTGATSVSAGTLALIGGSQASPITVSSGASLSFTLGSPTTSTSSFDLTNGTIKISGTPTLSSYTLITSSTGITGTPVLDVPITDYRLRTVGNSLVLEKTPYAIWAAGFAGFSNNLPAQDHDGDTYVNMMEYAFGTDPTVTSSGPISYSGAAVTGHGQPVLEEVGGVWYAVFGRRTDYVSAGLVYKVEFSNALSAWTATSAVPTTIATDGVIDAVRVPFLNSVPSDSGPQKPTFFRVEVTQP